MQKKIHHVGIAVPSINEALEFHIKGLGMKQESEIIEDEILNVKLVLLSFPQQHIENAYLELVEPLKKPSPIDEILERKNRLYHYCIEVPNLKDALKTARENHGIIVKRPTPAKLFNGRLIAFVWTTSNYLIEFLETRK